MEEGYKYHVFDEHYKEHSRSSNPRLKRRFKKLKKLSDRIELLMEHPELGKPFLRRIYNSSVNVVLDIWAAFWHSVYCAGDGFYNFLGRKPRKDLHQDISNK